MSDEEDALQKENQLLKKLLLTNIKFIRKELLDQRAKCNRCKTKNKLKNKKERGL